MLSCLEVPEFIDLRVGEVPYNIVRSNRFIVEEFRQTILIGRDARVKVELTFEFEDVFAEIGNVVTCQVDAEPGVDHVDKGREAFGNVQSREGNEDAHAG